MDPYRNSKIPTWLISILICITGVFFHRAALPAENDSLPVSLLKYSAGLASAVLIHEGSHCLVAGVTNTHLTWKVGSYNQPLGFTDHANSDAKGVAIYSSGLIAQAIGSEIILQADGIDKNDAFIRGMMTWNIVNPILYSLDYWLFHVSNKIASSSYQGDLGGIEHYANEPTAQGFALAMTAIAGYQGYRFLQTQSWAPDWLRSERQHIRFLPHPSGGLLMTFHFTF